MGNTVSDEDRKRGNYLRDKREQLGLTQKDVAEKVGVSDKTVSKWENGGAIPQEKNLKKMLKVLCITREEFWKGEDIGTDFVGPALNDKNEKEDDAYELRVTLISVILGIAIVYIVLCFKFRDADVLHLYLWIAGCISVCTFLLCRGFHDSDKKALLKGLSYGIYSLIYSIPAFLEGFLWNMNRSLIRSYVAILISATVLILIDAASYIFAEMKQGLICSLTNARQEI